MPRNIWKLALIILFLPRVGFAQVGIPFISQPLVPTAGAPGGSPFSLTVNGTGFVLGATVNWNGTALPTLFVNGEQLIASAPGIDVASPRTASITVVNPGVTASSNVVSFSVASSTPSVAFSNAIGSPLGNVDGFLAAGDFNGDGKTDIVGATLPFGLIAMLGNGDGTFVASNAFGLAFPRAVAVGDFNGDGKLDVVITDKSDQVSNRFVAAVFLGNGDGTFLPANSAADTGVDPLSIAVGDFNGDGKLDLAVANAGDNTLAILLGNGDGTLTPATLSLGTGSFPISVVTGDFNRDGKLDLAVANELGNSLTILLGNGDGTFTPTNSSPAIGAMPTAIAVGDFNADGKLDLAVANFGDGTVTILLGNGDGTFTPTNSSPATGASPRAIAVGDFNADGKLDLVVAVGQSNGSSVTVLLGHGDGTFTSTSIITPGEQEAGPLVAGDFNNDGRLDLAIANVDSSNVSILLQQAGTPFAPKVSLSTLSLGFPNQTVNTTSVSMAVTVTNTGNAPLNITATPTTVGANANNFTVANGTTCKAGSTVVAGSSCIVEITFTPSTTASESAALSIYDNVANSPQAVSLTGTGVAPIAPPPTISSLNPSEGVRGEKLSFVFINGADFQKGASVSFSGGQDISVSAISVGAPGQIALILTVSPTATLGLHDVIVTNPDSQSSREVGALNILSVPPAPENLTAKVGSRIIYLGWNGSPSSLDGYNVYISRVDNSIPTLLGKVNATSGLVTTLGTQITTLPDGSALQNGQLYELTVTSVAHGMESTPSVQVFASPGQFVAPRHPLHPVLFLHGIHEKASDWMATTQFIANTLGWESGGTLSYRSTDDPRVDPPQTSDFSPLKDFYTVNFGDNLANYADPSPDPSQGIFRQGDEVGGFLRALQTKEQKFSLVAHSMGGLAARAYIQQSLQNPDTASAQIADLVTYGTPHKGVDKAYLSTELDLLTGAAQGVSSGLGAGALGDIAILALERYLGLDSMLSSRGVADMNSGCNANLDFGAGSTDSAFLHDINSKRLPSGINYALIRGRWPVPLFGMHPDECNPIFGRSIASDGVVPVTSVDISALAVARILETGEFHTQQLSDFPAILCALDQNCLEFEVKSPVYVQITSPNKQSISNNANSMPGAEYVSVVDDTGEETSAVLIPFPVGGQYAIVVTPKPDALPTDTFTILQTQNGVTTTIANNLQIASIPSGGFQTTVKNGSTYSVNFGGSVQQPLTKDGSGHFVATLTITNQGNVAVDSVQVGATGTTLSTASMSVVPAVITSLASGASATVTLTFPITSALSTATSAPLKISGTYSAGTLSGNWSLTFRSVALAH